MLMQTAPAPIEQERQGICLSLGTDLQSAAHDGTWGLGDMQHAVLFDQVWQVSFWYMHQLCQAAHAKLQSGVLSTCMPEQPIEEQQDPCLPHFWCWNISDLCRTREKVDWGRDAQ